MKNKEESRFRAHAKCCANVLMLLAVMAGSAQPHVFGDEFVSRAFDSEYRFKVNEDDVRNAPQWLDESDNPPLSARKAIQIAERVADKLITPRKQFHRVFSHAALKQVTGGWVWIIQFIWECDVNSTGLPNHLSIPILMNAEPVKPAISRASNAPFE